LGETLRETLGETSVNMAARPNPGRIVGNTMAPMPDRRKNGIYGVQTVNDD